jgi:hypothetical protein
MLTLQSEICREVTSANQTGVCLIKKRLQTIMQFIKRFKFIANMFILVHTDLYKSGCMSKFNMRFSLLTYAHFALLNTLHLPSTLFNDAVCDYIIVASVRSKHSNH